MSDFSRFRSAARVRQGRLFESITGLKQVPNVATANARYYEGRYLAGIAAGRLQPFRGPITDNTGVLRVAKGQSLSDAQILAMNWLVDGVGNKMPL